MQEWSQNTKINSSVLTSGFVGAVAAPGAVFCAECTLPHQMGWLKRLVADTVVMPHLEAFEKASSRLVHAREQRREKEGITHPPDPALQGEDPASARGRALAIADGMVTSMLAWSVDLAVTLGTQHTINKRLGINTSPLKTTMIDATVALGAMGVMPTLAAKPSEHLNHALSSILQKTTGMPKHKAEDFSVPTVYAGVPNLLGAMAALGSAHHYSRQR